MKLKVVSTFKDKLTGEVYPIGMQIEIADQDRVDDIVERKLAEVVVEVEDRDPVNIAVFGSEFEKKTLLDALKGAGVPVNANIGEPKLIERIASLTEEEMVLVKAALGIHEVTE